MDTMCSWRLSTSHDSVTKLNNLRHHNNGFCLAESWLETFVGQQDKKLKHFWNKHHRIAKTNKEKYLQLVKKTKNNWNRWN